MNEIPEILYITPAYTDPAQAAEDKARLQADAWGCVDMARKGNLEGARAILLAWATTCKGTANDEARLVLSYKGQNFLEAALLMGARHTPSQFWPWVAEVFRPAAWSIYDRKNNWGAWGLLGCVLADILLGRPLHDHVRRFEALVREAVEDGGRLWRECLRTNSGMRYAYFFLAPALRAAQLLEGRGYARLAIRLAPSLWWLWCYTVNPSAWPHRFDWLPWWKRPFYRLAYPCAKTVELPRRHDWPANLYSAAGRHFGIRDWAGWGQPVAGWDPPYAGCNIFREG